MNLWCCIIYKAIADLVVSRSQDKYKVGNVRISKVRGPFAKGYEENYTQEFFTITECITRDPPVYRLSDYDGDVIDSVFYEKEIQKILVSKNKTIEVEEREKTLLLVQWLCWPTKFASWIDQKELVDVQTP